MLKLWNVPDTILNKEKDSTVIKNEIAASDEQFYELLDYQYYIKQRVLNNLNSDHLLERMLCPYADRNREDENNYAYYNKLY
mgnify:CR=1 FL=1